MRKWRFLGWIILCIAVMFLPSAVSAAENVSSGTCGDDLTWTLDSEGTLMISGTGAMYGYSYNGSGSSPWKDNTNVKTVKIENGVTSIGSYV